MDTVVLKLQHDYTKLHKVVSGTSTDVYWSIQNPDVPADFIRLRDMDDGSLQITVKGKDRGTNENRLEIDVDTDSSLPKVLKLLQSSFGTQSGEVTKDYVVFWPTENKHLTISCYKIHGDDRVFIEVESSSVDSLRYWEEQTIDTLKESYMNMEKAPGSLYEMFILKEK